MDFLFSSPVRVVDVQPDLIPPFVVEALKQTDLSNPWDDTVDTTFKYDRPSNIFKDFSLPNFEKTLEAEVANYLLALGYAGDVSIKITEAWLNFYGFGKYQHFHFHPGADICAVYYVDADEDTGDLVFEGPSTLHEQFPLFQGSGSLSTAARAIYKPKTGRLILFPSYLKHAVLQNTTNKQRISLAVNMRIA